MSRFECEKCEAGAAILSPVEENFLFYDQS